MAQYQRKCATSDYEFYDDVLYRDGEAVACYGYYDLTDCCKWSIKGPDGTVRKDDFADPDMTPLAVRKMVMAAYGDE